MTAIEPLDDYQAVTDPEVPAEREHFKITDDNAASWAMRKLRTLRERQAEIDTVARDEIARIEKWHLAASGALVADTNFFTAILTHYAQQQRNELDRKSVSLPYGTIKSRAGTSRVEVSDVDGFLAWARVNAPALVRTREEPDKTQIKNSLVHVAGDMVIDKATGEVVPGVAIQRTDTSYTSETE
jgi:hypothetical protein